MGMTIMRSVFKMVVMIILLLPSVNARANSSDEEIIRAFLDCPQIMAAEKTLSRNAQPGIPFIVLINHQCGAVGCQYSALVALPFERRRADPFVVHLLGYVHVGPKGHITRVERVELVSVTGLEDGD